MADKIEVEIIGSEDFETLEYGVKDIEPSLLDKDYLVQATRIGRLPIEEDEEFNSFFVDFSINSEHNNLEPVAEKRIITKIDEGGELYITFETTINRLVLEKILGKKYWATPLSLSKRFGYDRTYIDELAKLHMKFPEYFFDKLSQLEATIQAERYIEWLDAIQAGKLELFKDSDFSKLIQKISSSKKNKKPIFIENRTYMQKGDKKELIGGRKYY